MQDGVYSAGSSMTRARKADAGRMGECFASTGANLSKFNIKNGGLQHVTASKTFPPFFFRDWEKIQGSDKRTENEYRMHPKIAATCCGR